MPTTTKRAPRRRLSESERQAQYVESLNRAQSGSSEKNEIIAECWAQSRGYENPQARVNLLTYGAWKALRRQVRKGETGCRLETYRPVGPIPKPGETDEHGKPKRRRVIPSKTHVFHESQTDPLV